MGYIILKQKKEHELSAIRTSLAALILASASAIGLFAGQASASPPWNIVHVGPYASLAACNSARAVFNTNVPGEIVTLSACYYNTSPIVGVVNSYYFNEKLVPDL
jgi:hypothetical protein